MWKTLIAAAAVTMAVSGPASAVTVLGTGTGSLIGNDLTDLGNDGNENAYSDTNRAGFDADFFSNVEPGFQGGEFAFNVFDNQLGPGNAKFCCNFPGGNPVIIGAMFDSAFELTSFTLSSANDVPNRDPIVWQIEGSNNTTSGLDGDWDPIFVRNGTVSDWASRLQVNHYAPENGDTFLTSEGFSAFRLVISDTIAGTGGGANVQVGELELFGVAQVLLPPAILLLLGAVGMLGAMRRREVSV
ncbi:MAG: PEP-CTERM sorting domain-containing protein [Pseudomonadota bacterium]